MELTFGPSNTEQDVMITIIDDERLEPDEQFNTTVFLTVTDPSINLNLGVILAPNVSTVYIEDDDSNDLLGFIIIVIIIILIIK